MLYPRSYRPQPVIAASGAGGQHLSEAEDGEQPGVAEHDEPGDSGDGDGEHHDRVRAVDAIGTITGIARLVVFGDTGLFPIFGFAQVLPPAPAAAASR